MAVFAHYRNVRDGHQFMADAQAIFGSAEAADLVLNDIKFVLAREPLEAGVIQWSAKIWVLKTHPVPAKGEPRSLLIVFSFDATQVEMLRLL